ncbi:tumor necrosis factor receptor superfamily member 6B-like [Triplophysa dalaica]|uniref:tumor necrosis factor receptor superfamily member 6B-like n=1 Tax=Triplophysa dalaica TaxID=1582913 RepID=UPI0024DFE297|nr:tumor necrosis factor receptor superfamily member 6B-like [Triplophysa dalaica]
MLLLALMLFVSCTDASTVEVPTYQHMDRQTGQILKCKQCPAGTYMVEHCTPTRDTVCSPCPANHFTQYWNYLPNCLYCGIFCVENQHVKVECSPKNNRVCECNDGFFWHAEFCIKHTECPSGDGVHKKGTVHSDTVCERCPRGTFSAGASSSAKCVKHTDCESMGLVVMLNGSRWHDNVCMTCQNIQKDGGLSILRDFLPQFFAHQKIRLSKLKRVVRNLGQRQQKRNTVFSKRDFLLNFFSEWIKAASIDQLKGLPKTLHSNDMHKTAEKLFTIFNKLDVLIMYNCIEFFHSRF